MERGVTRCGGAAAEVAASAPPRVPNGAFRTRVARISRVSRIAERATTLHERLAAPRAASVVSAPSAAAAAHLARWRTVAAADDAARFAERLRWSRLTLADAAALANAPAMDEEKLPGWAMLLAEALEATPDETVLDPTAPLPFEAILLPFVRAAHVRLLAADVGPLADTASHDLRRTLLARLSATAEQALYVAFRASRATYARFVARMTDGGLGDFLEEHAALGRLLGTQCAQWADACVEMLHRLRADADDIAAALDDGAPLGMPTRVEAGVSDPHRGGRTVCLLTFASGARVAYKPRGLGLERAFAELLAWLNDGRVDPPLRPLRVLDRGTHGWMEVACPAECATDAEVERFYRRGGMLLCLMYVLGGEDFHSDNVLACGEQPALIDLEVLLRPVRAPDVIGGAPARPVWRWVHESVLRTGLLPELHLMGDAAGYHEGGLAVRAGADGVTSREWAHVNTDAMCVTERPAAPSARPHVPRREWDTVDPAPWVLRGFRHMYDALAAHRDALLAPNGPLDAFRGLPVRVVLRQTRLYHTLLRRTLGPATLRDGVARSVELEVLKRPATASAHGARLWPVLDDEQRALEVLDVPAFWIPSDGTALETSCGEITAYATVSGMDAAAARLRAANDADRERQAHCVRIAYASQRWRLTEPREPPAARDGLPLTDAAAVAEACRIAALLERLAVRTPDGGATWYALTPDGEAPGIAPLGVDVASGGGVAVVLAVLAERTGDAGHRALAAAALRPAGGARLPNAHGDGRCRWCGQATAHGSAVEDALCELDYLCCGTFARVEALLGAAVARGDEALHRRACVLAGRAVARARRRGTYSGALDSAFMPGLLGGLAGIGYELLRLHRPDAVPSLGPRV